MDGSDLEGARRVLPEDFPLGSLGDAGAIGQLRWIGFF
jgi:hypothetical protein